MPTHLSAEIVQALLQHGNPLPLTDSDGNQYVVMTDAQFQKYAYDDSDLTDDEMIAAAVMTMDDPAPSDGSQIVGDD